VQQHTFVETHNALDTLCRIALSIQQGSYTLDLWQGQCTFFLVGVVYQGISALLTIRKGKPLAEIEESITILRWLLRHLRTRWLLSSKSLGGLSRKNDPLTLIEGVYEGILDAKEAMLTAEAI
jgi:hypothetical protein